MKTAHLLPALVLATFAVSLVAQQKGQKNAPKLKWRIQQLHKDHNEGLAIGDITLVGDEIASCTLVRPFDLVLDTGYRYVLRYPADQELRSEVRLMWEWFGNRL